MDVVDEWDGRRACALQDALRMTGEEFAEQLHVAVRTVRDWRSRPDTRPRAVIQQTLDVMLEQASDGVKTRFRHALVTPRAGIQTPAADTAIAPAAAAALTVGIAIVVTERDVLVVRRRDDASGGISWQFPAGVVKPGGDAGEVAVQETFAETGVHCQVRQRLGRRLHPITHVYCEYFLCDYLAGEAQNRDVVENASVTWVRRDAISRFIPKGQLFVPVLHELLEDHEAAAS